jgi:hypothetical protein
MIATLERVAFKTSRLAEFCSQKELIAQTGQAVADWPMVILKELVDNALDACEEAEIAPEITIEVSAETGEIVIADNGPGLPPATIEAILDYTSRVSSREAYVSPTRGAQGNALKTVIAMAFALDGNRGVTIIEAHGQAHRIIFEMDPVRREPRVLREISSSVVQIGTRVTVRWPNSASSVLEEAEARFVQIAGSFTTFNPHLSLSVRWNGDELVNISATDFGWRKWRACDPTNAHWYDVERFGRYMAAHIARDQDDGRIGRTVAEFIAELRGLSRSDKRKLVLAEAEASGVSLSSFFEGGEGKVERLLTACKVQTEPVKPQQLGIIGSDHLLAECLALGGAEESFKYKRHIGVNDFGPYVLEAAFAYCPDDGDDHDATIITGVNFSVGNQNPFERLGPLLSLSSLLEHQRAGRREPIVFILHYTCPRIDYADRGKSGVYLPEIVTTYIYDLVTKVTADWAKQRKREERDSSRQRERRDRLVSTQKVTIKDAAFEVMERAYDKASGVVPREGASDYVRCPPRDPFNDRQGYAQRPIFHADSAGRLYEGAPRAMC